jgi:hypothetical protein
MSGVPSALRCSSTFRRSLKIAHPGPDVVHAFSALRYVLADRRVLPERLQQLDPALPHPEHRFLDALLLHPLAMGERDSERSLVERDRRVQIPDGDPNVVHSVEHGAGFYLHDQPR